MAPSYEQNTAKLGEIHGTVNLGFKPPVHEGYNVLSGGGSHRKVSTIPLPETTLSTVIRMQFEEIHINSHEIRTKFVRFCYEFDVNRLV